MPTISVSTETKARLAALRTTDPARDSYGEVVKYLLDTYDGGNVLPVRLVLVVPGDVHNAGLVTAPCGTFTVQKAIDHLRNSWAASFNTWLSQSGYVLDFDIFPLISKYTLQQMRVPTDPAALSGSFVWGNVAPEHPKLAADMTAGAYRHSLVVVGGDGYAGGANSGVANTWGRCIIGDWEFYRITGQMHPTVVNDALKDGRSWSHEMLHMLGAYCHSGDCFNDGHFGVPGDFGCIDERFTSFPLQQWVDDQGNILTPSPDDEHFNLETKLYAGQVAQFEKWSPKWLRAA